MNLFSSEAEMQEWLSGLLVDSKNISDIIINLEYLKSFSPANFYEKRIHDSYRICLDSLYITEMITKNENISVDPHDILKPDFVLYAPETESVVIVELKNISGPTRQAGTELAAYSCEIKSAIPFISDGDIVNVIVSTEWPALLKHYIFHQIFWQKKNVILSLSHLWKMAK